MELNTITTTRLIELALEEDLSGGDLTARCTVSPEIRGQGEVLAREQFVVCGLPLISRIVALSGFSLEVKIEAEEGEQVSEGKVLATISGAAMHILALERTVLNFLQRLSGVATYTRQAIAKTGSLVILDTRKTMPGWRILDKYATRTGGARNHRFNLSDLILIKDNHIDANGGSITRTLQRVFDVKPYYTPVEIEVRSLVELKEALKFAVDVVMLDNFSDEMITEALQYCSSEAEGVRVEVSGGITPERLPVLEKLGVHAVSMGALTTRARNVDISLDLKLEKL